jgi:hypothetical protein
MGEQFSPAALARLAVEEFRRSGPALSEGASADLAHRIETVLRTALLHEREACAALCRRRRELWGSTEERPGAPALLRQEARARSNEAAWLEDALRARRP